MNSNRIVWAIHPFVVRIYRYKLYSLFIPIVPIKNRADLIDDAVIVWFEETDQNLGFVIILDIDITVSLIAFLVGGFHFSFIIAIG